MHTRWKLRGLKAAHTVIWAIFAACIVAIPVCSAVGKLDAAFLLILIVWVEVMVLALNEWKCPLTGVAANYTSDRGDNFDIYLPNWLARHNKAIFGSLYALGVMYSLYQWVQGAAG